EGRCYFGGGSAIVARDLHTLMPIGSTLLPGVSGVAGRLIRWGTNGRAFQPNGSQVAIVRSLLVPSAPPADLVLSQVSASGPTLIGGIYACTFAISNAGPKTATNVAFPATLPPNTMLVSITSPNGTGSAIAGGVIANIPSLENGATASVTYALTPNKPGPFAFKAGVLSGSRDTNLANNRLSIDVPATFISGYDSVIEMALTANDLAYDAVHARICASLPNGNELLGNSIVTFDPLSAFYPSIIPTAVEPGKLAASDN